LNKEAELVKFDFKKTMDCVEDDKGKFGFVIDDFKFAKNYYQEHPELYPYTLVDGEDDDNIYIIDGWHIVNRIGYLFGKNKVENVNIIF
jgi:hypothetical protein